MHISDIQIRDPFVIPESGVYYLFGSTDKDIWNSKGYGFDVYMSSSGLEEFDGPFPAFRPSEHFWSEKNFWAPEIHKYCGMYYMFATFLPKKGRRGTAVLKSGAGIMGPYLPWSVGPVTPPDWECLDGTFFIDDEGKPYMVFCHEWKQAGEGEIWAMPLSADLRQTAGESWLLFRASEAPWSAPLKGRTLMNLTDRLCYVTDGPFMWRTKMGALLLLWSSFGEDGAYRIGIARSESGTLRGPWKQNDMPLYAADGGHGMLFHSFDGKLRLAIHSPNGTPNERAAFIEVVEKNGALVLS
ncbi:MAG: glycoside hydrolase family 43 protein [Treponema sp.]|jgi:hypothetical protein|nr:glycoside hydrolase family 43 protein [Treponema sp.]